jgi:hypothetical protein
LKSFASVSAIREILQEIKSGKKSFAPRSLSEPDMVEFQSIAKALAHANDKGYLDGFSAHHESSTPNNWYDLVIVKNGLSYAGETFLIDSDQAAGSNLLADRDSASAAIPSYMAEHLHILELASRNKLPNIADRKSPVSFQIICELLNAGHISGLFAQSTNGASIIGPAITFSGRLFLEERRRRPESSSGRGTPQRITLDTNCVINLFDRQSISASSVSELSSLIQYGLSGRITIAITTRVETDLLNDPDPSRRSEMVRTLGNFPVIGTVGRWDTSKWDSGDVFADEALSRQRNDIQGIVFPGLQTTDKRYGNKRNDVDHLLGHLLNRQDIFVTDDKDILRHSERLQRGPGIVVMSPRQVIAHLDLV